MVRFQVFEIEPISTKCNLKCILVSIAYSFSKEYNSSMLRITIIESYSRFQTTQVEMLRYAGAQKFLQPYTVVIIFHKSTNTFAAKRIHPSILWNVTKLQDIKESFCMEYQNLVFLQDPMSPKNLFIKRHVVTEPWIVEFNLLLELLRANYWSSGRSWLLPNVSAFWVVLRLFYSGFFFQCFVILRFVDKWYGFK